MDFIKPSQYSIDFPYIHWENTEKKNHRPRKISAVPPSLRLSGPARSFHPRRKGDCSYGHLPAISTYNPIYRMYNPIYNQL